MKQAIFLIWILALLPLAHAQTQVNLGFTPDSNLFFVDKLLKNIRLMLAGEESRISLKAQFLNERALETQYIAEKKPQFTGKALAELKKSTDDLAEEAEAKPKHTKELVELNLKNSKIVLEGIIKRFESDNNTNNDNAITGLKIAIKNQEKKIDLIKDSKGKNEIDIKIKGDIGEVKAIINNQEVRYKVASVDVNEILNDISARTGASIDTIKNADVELEDQKIKVEIEQGRIRAKIEVR